MAAARRVPPQAKPKEQLAGKEAWNACRSASANFYTFGYSGRTAEQIVAALQGHGVRTVLDVRHRAMSLHRPDFSKRRLQERLAAAGIGYAHAPELGVPSEIRAQAAEAGTRQTIWNWYDVSVLASADLPQRIGQFEQPVALMCSELDPQECHRHRLALALERAGWTSFDL